MKKGFRPHINYNISSLKESSTLAINMKAKELRSQGHEVHHFGFGQSPFAVHSKIQIALAKAAHEKDYLPTRGLPKLCEMLAWYHREFFKYNLDPNMILIGPGSKELIFQALYVLEGEVFVPAPSWVSYGPQLNIRGKKIHAVLTKRENSYKLQADELAEACERDTEQQKILILNNPSNPTGAVYTEEEIVALSKVCRDHRIIVIADEIYALTNFSGRPYVSFHQHYPEGTIVTGGLSKSHAAGGYRMGFMALAPNMEEVIKSLSAMISETFSAVSSPIQYAALEAYSGDYDLMSYIKQCTRIHKVVGEYMHKRFIDMGLNCPKPEGAFYLFPDFSNFKDSLQAKGIHSCVDLAGRLLIENSVATLPGDDFYYPKENYGIRVATVDYNGENVYQESLKPVLHTDEPFALLDDSFVEENCPSIKRGCDEIENFIKELE